MIKIVKWNETFENADSRKRQRLGFFYAPSGCDSSGYLTLMSEFPQKDALLALGVFMALCQQSATMKKGVRGTFLKGCGQPMNEKQICMLIHVDACHLRAALKVLTDSRVKWVEMIADKDGMPLICQSSASDVPQNSGFVQGQGEGQGEGEGEVLTPKPPSSDGVEIDFYLTKSKRKMSGKRLTTFLAFWDAFGYKDGKAEAADAWLSIPQLTDSLVETIIEAAKREATNRGELMSRGKTPKMAQGWLNARRWENEGIVVEATTTHKPKEKPAPEDWKAQSRKYFTEIEAEGLIVRIDGGHIKEWRDIDRDIRNEILTWIEKA